MEGSRLPKRFILGPLIICSVKFCNTLGLTYVSCSPYRVPTARLAAAQAALEQE